MQLPKSILVLLIFLYSCSRTNLLSYRIRSHYKETDSYMLDSTIFFKQSIRYDRPWVNDEEFSFGAIFFIDSLSLREDRAINLKDTSVIRYYHSLPDRFTYHFYGDPYPYYLVGELTLLKWTDKKIRLKERITVIDSSGKKLHSYHGRRNFNLDDTSAVRRMWF